MGTKHTATALEHEHATHHDHAHDHDEHHETFVSKYVFSMDHKMISRQFLITAIVMAVVAMTMSVIFGRKICIRTCNPW
jgi:cytochrome c oxidase subunit 1